MCTESGAVDLGGEEDDAGFGGVVGDDFVDVVDDPVGVVSGVAGPSADADFFVVAGVEGEAEGADEDFVGVVGVADLHLEHGPRVPASGVSGPGVSP